MRGGWAGGSDAQYSYCNSQFTAWVVVSHFAVQQMKWVTLLHYHVTHINEACCIVPSQSVSGV
jgi:hypothetical protein